MAKDLPYFKFFCSEWNDGDITLETYEHQGLFINICSYYWSNECNVHFDKLLKRFRRCEELIDDLSAAGLFKIKEDRFISISFLDEQREERLEQSKDKSKAGKASAEARRLKKLQQESNTNPTEIQQVLKSCSTESQLLRREEKREEEIRKDNIKEDVLYNIEDLKLKYEQNERLINAFCEGQKTNKETILLRLKEFNVHLASVDKTFRTWDDYTSHFKNWFIKKPKKKSNKKPHLNITS